MVFTAHWEFSEWDGEWREDFSLISHSKNGLLDKLFASFIGTELLSSRNNVLDMFHIFSKD